MRIDRLRGNLDLLILAILAEEPRHGYAVITGLRERTSGALDLTEGAVYPALHRLEDLGVLKSEWQTSSGRRRRLYQLTTSGKRTLATQRKEWLALVTTIESVLRPQSAIETVGAL